MLSFVQNLFDQVREHVTWVGQIWYVVFFVFRIIVVGTFGAGAYGDEHSTFYCSTNLQSCKHMCFAQFAQLSYLRFWNLQLLFVASPIVFFHMYVYHLTKKAKKVEEHNKKVLQQTEQRGETELQKLRRNKRAFGGEYRMKIVDSGLKRSEVLRCRNINLAYLACLFVQIIAEVAFVFIGMRLFNIKNGIVTDTTSLQQYLWMEIPAKFECGVDKASDLMKACHQHLINEEDYVACWVSRPWEKTIIVRYMNILSVVCTCITLVEFMFITVKLVVNWHKQRKSLSRSQPSTSQQRDGFNTSEDFFPM